MPKRASKKRSNPPPAKAALLGLLLSLAIILLLATVGGLLIAKGTIPENASGIIGALGVFLAAAFAIAPGHRQTDAAKCLFAYGAAAGHACDL